jgi:hypothetical protein
MPTILHQKVVGKATGIMIFASGIVFFLNFPMKDLAVKHLDGDFFVPNLVYMVLVLPCIPAAWGIGRTAKRENAAKQLAICENFERSNYSSTSSE